MFLKLSGVLRLQKVRQMVITQGYEHLGPRPGDDQTCLKVAWEKFRSSTHGYEDAKTKPEAVS